MINDPERPWLEWRRGKQITQKQLAGLLRPFGIISDTVHPRGLPQGKGYKRADFEELWECYLDGPNGREAPGLASEAYKRTSADGTGTSRVFLSVQEAALYGSCNLAHSHAGLYACPDRKPESGAPRDFDQARDPLPLVQPAPDFSPGPPVAALADDGMPAFLRRAPPEPLRPPPYRNPPAHRNGQDKHPPCAQCNSHDGQQTQRQLAGDNLVWLHKECVQFWLREREA
ncbi:MAG: DUF3631 domain-containing protein [Xanthobacteraceae bacterium]